MRNIAFEEPPPVQVTLAMAALRLITGLVVAAHGWRELQDLGGWEASLAQLGVPAPEVVAPISVAGALFVGLALAMGWLTRLSALSLLCVAPLGIAALRLHGLFARDGGFESPLLLAAIALALLATGGGRRLSVDRLLLERARRRAILSDERWQLPPYIAAPSKPMARSVGGRAARV